LDALVLGELVTTYADVAGGLEQPIVALLGQPTTDPQVRLAPRVIGHALPSGLDHPVVAEAIPGVAADRVGDPLAAAVNDLEQAKLKTRPKCLGHHVGRLRGRCRCVGEVELATDARQRTQHLPIKRAQLIEVLAEEFGGRSGDLDRRQDTQVPGRVPPGADGNERSFPLRAMQQLTDLQRIARVR